MASSNFKLFDENKTNMMQDGEYGTNNQRLNGLQSGIASSMLQNKFQYQMSLISYAIGQLMVQNNIDAMIVKPFLPLLIIYQTPFYRK